jgi:hypothetical protein
MMRISDTLADAVQACVLQVGHRLRPVSPGLDSTIWRWIGSDADHLQINPAKTADPCTGQIEVTLHHYHGNGTAIVRATFWLGDAASRSRGGAERANLTYELAGSLDEIRRVAFLLDDEQEAKDNNGNL